MTVSSIGWLVPAILTLAFLAGTLMLAPRVRLAGPGLDVTLFEILCYCVATILSLVAWLIWAVL